MVPSLLDPLYYVQIPYQQDVERYADSLEPETRVNVPYGSTESGLDYYIIVAYFKNLKKKHLSLFALHIHHY